MLKLPEHFCEDARLFWPHAQGSVASNYDEKDITVVTAFFDLGRGEWKVGQRRSPFQRSTDQYFEYFSHLAKLRNPMVIFVAPEHAERVLKLRKEAGLQDLTTIFTIDRLFERAKLKALCSELRSKMTPALRRWVRFPMAPEYNSPEYVLINALKAIFVNTAIRSDAVPTQQIAWLDFGYARDANCFDAGKAWRYDCKGKMVLFNMRPIDDTPVFKIVQRGYVFIQGTCHIGPRAIWPEFAKEIDRSLADLLSVDLVDDDQTLAFMAVRRNPALYRIYPMDRRDWRVAIRYFNEEMQGEDVKFADNRLVDRLRNTGLGQSARNISAWLGRYFEKFT